MTGVRGIHSVNSTDGFMHSEEFVCVLLDTGISLPYTGTGIETENRVIQHDYCEVTKRIHDLEKTDAKSD